jgi:peroxiredoxin
MIELRGLQLSLPKFQELGVQVVAISPDPVEKNRSVVERIGLEFPVLSDSDLSLIGALGLQHEGAGPGGTTIPRPATLIVRNGAIVWRNLTENYRVRPRPEDVLAALASVGIGNHSPPE